LPEADAGAESDIWLSPLIQTGSTVAMLFEPGVLPVLRRQLKLSGRLEEVWRILVERHNRVPPPVQWEERVTYFALRGENMAAIEPEMLKAVAALRQVQDRSVARWVARVVHRLPEPARQSDAGRILDFGAAVQLGKTPVLGDPPPNAVE